MNREIKFRVFYNGVMIYGVTVATDPLHVWIDDEKIPDSAPEDFYDRLTESDVGYWILDNFELMQYTGLKDCNGKDIYEGDIVLIQYGTDGNTSKPLEKSVEVKYTTNLFYGCCFTADGFQLGPTCEVIGNIHENPELI